MDKRKRSSGSRPRKHKFRGNQHTISKTDRRSSSGKKLHPTTEFEPNFDGYCIFDRKILLSFIEQHLSCNICHSPIKLNLETISGLSEKIILNCKKCETVLSTRNSIMSGPKSNMAEINARFFYALRCIGQGFLGAKTFCGVMDLPPTVSKTTYSKIVDKMETLTSKSAQRSMTSAAVEEVQLTGSTRITISGDGTWKTRGHSSLIGVCTVVGANSGKVLDTEVLSSSCKGCNAWKGVRKGADFEAWSKDHKIVCSKNHEGSAAMMEVTGMCRIFLRSKNKHDVFYENYIGDGDSKTFLSIKKLQPYEADCEVSKIECVGHVQKRMGARLRKRKSELRGQKLSDGKPIGGKGRLTDALIDKLTVYYGNAIREHSTSVKKMQAAIWAIYYHKSSTDSEPLHNFCPEGSESWCPFQKAIANNKNYHHQNSVPSAVMQAIKDIFKDLSMPKLLKKCLGGHTQNNNESLNSLIWKFCPKTTSSGKKIAQIAANEAVVCFNEGQLGRIATMKTLNFQIGKFCIMYAKEADELRISVAEKRAEGCTLEARRAKRRKLKAKEEAQKLAEGSVYAPGEF